MKNAIKKASLGSGLLAMVLVASFQCTTAAQGWRAWIAASQPLEEAAIYLELNHTDNDLGVHIDIDHDVGLRELLVASPDGRSVVGLTWRDMPPLGLTEMKTETAEPTPARLLQSYPAGVYRFLARTVDGRSLASVATLSHQLLPAPTITTPADGDEVPASGVTAAWNPVPGAQGYVVEFEEENGGGLDLEAFVPRTSNTFAIPAGLLMPDTDYKIGVAALHPNGNLSLSENEFSTGG